MLLRWTIAIVVVAVSGAFAAKLRLGDADPGLPPNLASLERHLSGWDAEDVALSDGTDEALGADLVLRRCYRGSNGSSVWLFVAYFSNQRVNKQIHSPKNCLPGGGWRIAEVGERREIVAGGVARDMTRMVIRKGGSLQEVLYWMQTPGGATGDEYRFKWLQTKNALRGRPSNAAFVRYNASLEDSAAIREVMGLLDGPLQTLLASSGMD